jgi:hypothetical protein
LTNVYVALIFRTQHVVALACLNIFPLILRKLYCDDSLVCLMVKAPQYLTGSELSNKRSLNRPTKQMRPPPLCFLNYNPQGSVRWHVSGNAELILDYSDLRNDFRENATKFSLKAALLYNPQQKVKTRALSVL